MAKSRPFDASENSRRLGRRSMNLGPLAWVLFGVGLLGMIVVVGQSLLGEGDGNFRTAETVRRQVNLLWGARIVAAGGPLLVWLIQRWLDHRDRSRSSKQNEAMIDPFEL